MKIWIQLDKLINIWSTLLHLFKVVGIPVCAANIFTIQSKITAFINFVNPFCKRPFCKIFCMCIIQNPVCSIIKVITHQI